MSVATEELDIEFRPAWKTSRVAYSYVFIDGIYAFRENVYYPKPFAFLVGGGEMKITYLFSPDGIDKRQWLEWGAKPSWLWRNPYGEGFWCTLQNFDQAVALAMAFRKTYPAPE